MSVRIESYVGTKMFTSDTQIAGWSLSSSWQNKDFNLHWSLEIEDLRGRNANIIDTESISLQEVVFKYF